MNSDPPGELAGGIFLSAKPCKKHSRVLYFGRHIERGLIMNRIRLITSGGLLVFAVFCLIANPDLPFSLPTWVYIAGTVLQNQQRLSVVR